MLLRTLDVTNLHTNIPINEGISAIKEMVAIHGQPHDLPHISYIVEVLTVVLTKNYFDFTGIHYHQVSSTAMSTKLAPSYVKILKTRFKRQHVYIPLQPSLWKRFIDDIFLIWAHGSEAQQDFITHLNTVHPAIKFTSDISSHQIDF